MTNNERPDLLVVILGNGDPGLQFLLRTLVFSESEMRQLVNADDIYDFQERMASMPPGGEHAMVVVADTQLIEANRRLLAGRKLVGIQRQRRDQPDLKRDDYPVIQEARLTAYRLHAAIYQALSGQSAQV